MNRDQDDFKNHLFFISVYLRCNPRKSASSIQR